MHRPSAGQHRKISKHQLQFGLQPASEGQLKRVKVLVSVMISRIWFIQAIYCAIRSDCPRTRASRASAE